MTVFLMLNATIPVTQNLAFGKGLRHQEQMFVLWPSCDGNKNLLCMAPKTVSSNAAPQNAILGK